MAYVTSDPAAVRIHLTHEERKELPATIAKGIGGLTAALTAFGVPAFALPIIAAALTAHAAWEVAWMEQMDKGNGVILEAPTPLQHGMIVLVRTRYLNEIGDWATLPDTEIATWDHDIIATHLDHGAVGADSVEFVMRNRSTSGWAKGFILRDGEGSEWTEIAQGGQDVSNGLWYHQTKNGQTLPLIKAKTWGYLTRIVNLDRLDLLQPGDRVTFTWKRDS